ncbi:MAG: class I SAM-dependent methyltransferase, partial [Gammaproteobacteria bacterium]|nr:class I SAM-dependent methyltransferase [Gammaproteobacteria bacterium]
MSELAKTCLISACRKPASRVFEKSGAEIFVCTGCGCIMASVDYDPDQYESDDYYTMASNDVRDMETRWGFRSRYILEKVLEHSGAEPTLLDVGAGNGYFVHVAQRDLGLAATGIEISATAVKFSDDVLGVKLICGDATNHEGQYDIVTSFNVIEHVQDPEEHLANLLRLTKTGGFVVITTPNPNCIQRRVVGLKKWKMICPPHHINLFTMKALKAMAHSAAIEIVAHETLST